MDLTSLISKVPVAFLPVLCSLVSGTLLILLVEEFFLQFGHPRGGCLVVVINPNLCLVISMSRSGLLVEFWLLVGVSSWLVVGPSPVRLGIGGSTSMKSLLQSEQLHKHLSHF